MSAAPLRWAHCPQDGRLHLITPAGAATGGLATALCGVQLGAGDLTITAGSAQLCLACIVEAADRPPTAPRWALSPYDDAAHLLTDQPETAPGGHRPQRQARCGAVLPNLAAIHDRLPGRKCVQCDLYALADEHAPRFARQDK